MFFMFKEHEQKGFSQMCFMRAFGFIGDSMPQMFTKTLYDKHAQITICHSVSRRGYTVMNNFYILLFLTAFFASMTILTTIQIVNGQGPDMECPHGYKESCFGYRNQTSLYEDQSFLCKHEKHLGPENNHNIKCIIIDDDDFLNHDQLDTIHWQFMKDWDTFSVNDLVDMGDMK